MAAVLADGEEFKIVPINMLAFREIPRCDLTSARANVQLVTRDLTLFYASEELAESAWFGIMKKVSHLVAPLIVDAPIVGTSEERERRKSAIILSKKSLQEYCLVEASNLLSVQKYLLAIPAAVQALKFSKDVDGERSLAVVEPYLILAQSYLGLKNVSKSEEYLALARWIVLNSAECPDLVRSRMYMLMGRVCTAQGRFEEAKSEFSSAIYYMSVNAGAESVSVSMGYFRLGDVFLAQGNIECALAFFDKVVDIWYKYLTNLHAARDDAAAMAAPEKLTEEQLADGRSQLEQVLETRSRLLGHTHIATGEAQYTIGLFEYFLLGNERAAESFIVAAQKTYESTLGEAHASSQHVHSILILIRQRAVGVGGSALDGGSLLVA
jgi:tetratricopeptide (TPR) repeat protein